MKTPRIATALALGLLSLAAAGGPAVAATARASNPIPLYSGPNDFNPMVGRLAAGEVVHLDSCTPDGRWCRVIHNGPTGWALASFLVGAQAKLDATPGRSITEDQTTHEGLQTHRRNSGI